MSKSAAENSFALLQETLLPLQDLKLVVLYQHLIYRGNSHILTGGGRPALLLMPLIIEKKMQLQLGRARALSCMTGLGL